MKDFKYQKIYNLIIKDIESGYLKQHNKIPSVRKMALALNVSKTPVENAYTQV
ncbi:MAG: GntR family transcriptional regulator [Coprobacillaceae bacterium]